MGGWLINPRVCYFASANENFLLWGHFAMISLFLLRMTHPCGSLLNPFVPLAMCIVSVLHRSHAFAPALYGYAFSRIRPVVHNAKTRAVLEKVWDSTMKYLVAEFWQMRNFSSFNMIFRSTFVFFENLSREFYIRGKVWSEHNMFLVCRNAQSVIKPLSLRVRGLARERTAILKGRQMLVSTARFQTCKGLGVRSCVAL